jgi:hypothetical protein
MLITLTQQNMATVREIVQHHRTLHQNKPNGHGAKPDAISLDDEIGGMGGELAAAKFFRVRWNAQHTDATNVADIGRYTQVRTLVRPGSRNLLVRPYDIRKYGNVPYLLVCRESELDFRLIGWIMAQDVPFRGRLCNGGDDSRPPVYFVGPEELEPVQYLRFV